MCLLIELLLRRAIWPMGIFPDNSISLAQRWRFVGSIVGSTLTNDFGSMSFCSSGRLNCQRLVRCCSNAVSLTTLHTNHSLSSIALGQRWSDLIKVTCFFKNPLEKPWFSRLRVDVYSYLPQAFRSHLQQRVGTVYISK